MPSFAHTLRILALAALGLVISCTDVYRKHGYIPRPEELARVDVGDNREEVAEVIGRPAATGLLNDDHWVYVRSEYQNYGWRAKNEVDREVVIVSFEGDRVGNIETIGLQDGRVVAFDRRVTDSNTTGVPFLRQIFRNLGNFNPADFMDRQRN